ncbi:MAG: tetratricopeptide repeat protein [Bacteroidales bacterium]|nr:tetratricopeptide repeat protein [Bacteroidales bacterium]
MRLLTEKSFIAILLIASLLWRGTAFSQDLNSAINMTYQQQFEAAESAFNSLIKADPTNGKNFYYSGENQLASYFIDTANISFKKIGKQAAERYNLGITANPNEALNYIGLGKVSLIQNETTFAKENFAKAMSFLPAKKTKSGLSKPDQATILVRIAEAYVQVGTRDTALVFDLFRRAESLDNKNPDLFLFRGDYWIYTLNNGTRAAENYRRSQDFSPQSTRARLRLGQLYTRIKSYQEALGYYQDAIAIDPSFAPAYLELGFLYAKTNQSDESKKYFKKYLEMSSSNIAAKRRYANMLIQTEDYKEAIEQITQIQAYDSVSYNDLNRALAYSYFEEKQYPQAKYYITKFVDNSPVEKITSKDYQYYGRILVKNGLDSLAAFRLTQAFKLDTTNTDLLNEIAASYLKYKKYENAAIAYQEKISRTGGSTNDYYKMARAYFDAKVWGLADSALAVVNRMSPDFEPAYLFRARVYANLDPDTKEGIAKPFYEKLLEKATVDSVKYNKDILEAYNYLGYYYLVNKQYCESISYWDKIAILEPANENALSAIKDLKPRCPEFKSSRP